MKHADAANSNHLYPAREAMHRADETEGCPFPGTPRVKHGASDQGRGLSPRGLVGNSVPTDPPPPPQRRAEGECTPSPVSVKMKQSSQGRWTSVKSGVVALPILLWALTPPPLLAQTAPGSPSKPPAAGQKAAPKPTRPTDQAPAPAGERAPATGTVAPGMVPTELTSEPYEIPSLGMSVYLPAGSLVDLSRIEGGRTTVVVRPEGDNPRWSIQIQNSISSDTSLTAARSIQAIIEQRQKARRGRDDKGKEFSLVRAFDRSKDLLVADLPVERVYMDVPLDASAPTSGYTLFHVGPGQFVIVQLECAPDIFPRVREIYELMVATTSFRDATELNADRAATVLAGEAFFKGLTNADYDAVLDEEPIFYRLYKPAASGAPSDAEEMGYQRVTMRRGFAGELTPKTPKEKWSEADKQKGIVVRSDARALTEGAVVDTISIFFLSEDRVDELWSITMVIRRGSEREQWTETGVRREDRLSVRTTRTGGEPTSAEWSPLPRGYLSRAETYLLPRLAVTKATPGTFGFYVYESSLGKMSLRRDTFQQDAQGRWSVTSVPQENSRPTTTELDSGGRIITRNLPGQQVMEPIEQARLRRIWADKQLPLQ